jgi:hypothetical protein
MVLASRPCPVCRFVPSPSFLPSCTFFAYISSSLILLHGCSVIADSHIAARTQAYKYSSITALTVNGYLSPHGSRRSFILSSTIHTPHYRQREGFITLEHTSYILMYRSPIAYEERTWSSKQNQGQESIL